MLGYLWKYVRAWDWLGLVSPGNAAFWQYVRAWDWRLFLCILLFIGLPNIYQLYRIY